LGNAFLSHIRAVDGIFHVLRVFEDDDVTHVEGAVDPIRDLQIISEELRKKDLETVQKHFESIEKVCKRAGREDKAKKEELVVVQKVLAWLNEEKEVRFGDWRPNEVDVINELHLLTAKPVIYIVNLSEADYLKKKNRWLVKIKEWIEARNKDTIIPCSIALEAKLLEMDDDQKKAYLAEHKTTSTIPKIIKTGYSALNLIHFFTSGTDEVKCWTVQAGTKAPQAGGVIHSDFLNGFVCAEVMTFEDYKELGSENAVKAAGKYLQQGKQYVVQDGDIIYFKVNAGAGLSKGK